MLFAKKNQFLNLFLLTIPSLVLFGISLKLTMLLWYPHGVNEKDLLLHIQLFSIIGLTWIALYYGFDVLDLYTNRRPNQFIRALIGVHFIGLIVAIVFFYLQPNFLLTPRRFLFVDSLFALLLSIVWQIIIRSLTKNSARQHVYLVNIEQTYSEQKQELSKQLPGYNIHFITEKDLLSLTEKTHRSHQELLFVVPINPVFSAQTLELFAHLHAHGATFVQFDHFYETLFRRVLTTNLNDWWMLEHIQRDTIGLYPIVKRVLDILFALLIAILFFLTFPFIALLIKLSDQGKIFFTQTRLSVNGAPFTIYKYRTMRAGTPNNTWTADHDPRVTSVGRFLRTTRLDELPQWINILRGDMSLIGPRPEQAGIVEQLREEIPYFESRHAIRPGLIGWAQLHVYAGTAAESKQKLQYDLYYLKHRSFLFDVEILLKTIAHVFFLQGK
ncbi:MAG: exopolysaccharide biosynthesis polyprenyl glycosylphosphotransferase [Candidatus Uhrbacteria bacterium]|nr:exopolysaccharide biosynthesis polyprenyl glycosylphosphotransferase [Candidatus Uhrbacteria bacterium]